jgi:hypothetical protein
MHFLSSTFFLLSDFKIFVSHEMKKKTEMIKRSNFRRSKVNFFIRSKVFAKLFMRLKLFKALFRLKISGKICHAKLKSSNKLQHTRSLLIFQTMFCIKTNSLLKKKLFLALIVKFQYILCF